MSWTEATFHGGDDDSVYSEAVSASHMLTRACSNSTKASRISGVGDAGRIGAILHGRPNQPVPGAMPGLPTGAGGRLTDVRPLPPAWTAAGHTRKTMTKAARTRRNMLLVRSTSRLRAYVLYVVRCRPQRRWSCTARYSRCARLAQFVQCRLRRPVAALQAAVALYNQQVYVRAASKQYWRCVSVNRFVASSSSSREREGYHAGSDRTATRPMVQPVSCTSTATVAERQRN